MVKTVRKTLAAAGIAAALVAGSLVSAPAAHASANNATPIYFTSYLWCKISKKSLEDEYSFAKDVTVSQCFYSSKRGQYYRVVAYNL
ncbi:hypothetical protein [Microlunatus soli]|uniref:Uncharacterized protein n=1 Tax=Microlunatus soli TaxID=630515 RepID=A0A1H1VQZ3_9ACTN|nr:hypothetical protein [Microlunatus soli]SDS86666.1 hypothetical protein SAMN04489812_3297 [Microlunatus soli]